MNEQRVSGARTRALVWTHIRSHLRRKEFVQPHCLICPWERDSFEGNGLEERIILIWILKKVDERGVLDFSNVLAVMTACDTES